MSHVTTVVKRGGKRPPENFDPAKLRASVCAACLSVRSPEGHAIDTAKKVCDQVAKWCNDKPEVTSADLRRQAADNLQKYQPEAAYLYKHHKVII